MAGLPLFVELLDQFRRVLQVAVEQHAGVLGGHFHAAAEGQLRAEVARVGDADDARVIARDGSDGVRAVVGAGIVDEDDLVIGADTWRKVATSRSYMTGMAGSSV